MIEPAAIKLVKYVRDGLVEQEHFGFVLLRNKVRIIDNNGNQYPFYLRSCAKPLQAALIFDFGMDKFFQMSEKEIALCCASHAGEKIHTEIAEGFLKKIGLEPGDLRCGLHKPISKIVQNELLKNEQLENVFHNNCVGKHIMMLGLCVMNGWDIKTYDDVNHPLQKEIKKKIYELCEVKKSYPITKDGCGVPIMAMPLENMVLGYLNLFSDYEPIKNAFLNYPYIIGGEDRLDTKIMQNSTGIVAKVGAGGLCIVINLEKVEGFIVKICDSDMKAREIVVIDTLKNLRWADIPVERYIKTLHGDVIGEIHTTL